MKVEQLVTRLEGELEYHRGKVAGTEAALGVLRELLGEEPAAPPRAPRKQGPKAGRTAVPKVHHAPHGQSRAAVLAVLTPEWAKVAEIVGAAGVQPTAGRVALKALRNEGFAEWNGELTNSSRWRLAVEQEAPKARRHRAPPPPPEDEEDDSGPLSED